VARKGKGTPEDASEEAVYRPLFRFDEIIDENRQKMREWYRGQLPPSSEERRREWMEAIARYAPAPSKPAKAMARKARSRRRLSELALPRGPRRKYDRQKLKQLFEQHPEWPAKVLHRRYERATGDTPSRRWVELRMQEFRRELIRK
jgi:hypothetical protein